MVSVEVSCPVFPSEDPDKICAALLNIFPTAVLEECDGKIFGPADLEAFSKLIRRQKILDTARNQMQKGTRGRSGRTIFNLNKQVATVGKVSFVDYRTALGTITVTVESDDLDALIDCVAPMTINGEEVRRVFFRVGSNRPIVPCSEHVSQGMPHNSECHCIYAPTSTVG